MVTREQQALAAADTPAPALDVVWDALADVPDPEVPVISIVELGIVRDVAWRDGRLRIAITPTYSGCPATELIQDNVREALARFGEVTITLQRDVFSIEFDITISLGPLSVSARFKYPLRTSGPVGNGAGLARPRPYWRRKSLSQTMKAAPCGAWAWRWNIASTT